MHRSPPVAVELVEALLTERPNELAHSVGPVVEGDHAVAGTDHHVLGGPDHRGLDELVGFVTAIGLLHGFDRTRRTQTLSKDKRVVGAFGAVPPVISVHPEVAPADGPDACSNSFATRCLEPPLHLGDVLR